MKKILTAVIVALSVFLIYLGFKDNDIYYLSLGDALANGINPYDQKDYGYQDYIKDYFNEEEKLEIFVDVAENDKRTTDIIREIKENKEILVNGKKRTFQNVLIKADLVTISIGTNDLLNNLNLNMDFSINDLYNKLDQVTTDFEEMFKLLRQYCKEKIILIGFYNFTGDDSLDEFFAFANNKIASIANSYDIDYVNLKDEFQNSNYFPNDKSKFPNKDGYKVIADKIIAIFDKKMLNS